MLKTVVSAYYCNDYNKDKIYSVVSNALKSLGVLSDIIKPNTKILIKPNLLSAYTPEQAITTHPEIVRAIVKIVKKANAVPVIGDSPGNILNGIKHVWEKTGMLKIAEEEKVELINFENVGSAEVSIQHPTIKQIHVTKALIDCDAIINLPKLKTHTLMGFSCGIKNFYGCIPGARKIEYHKLAPTPQDFAYLLSEIYRMVKEKLLFTLVDGVVGLEGNGPSLSGEKRSFNIIATSRDTVTLDTFLLNRIGFKNQDNILLKPLREKCLGNTNLKNVLYIGDDINKFDFSDIKLPVTKILNFLPRRFTRFAAKLFGKLFWVSPFITEEKCIGCLQCVKSCPAKAITVSDNKKPVINKGKCISCFCCHELCPHKAIDIKESFLISFFIKNEKK